MSIDSDSARAPLVAYSDVKDLLSHALDLPPRDRRPWIVDATVGHPELRRETFELLAQIEENDDFMTRGPRVPTDLPKNSAPFPSEPPATIGGIRILKTLGFGGMGVVYLGEQDRPRRKVAIKVLHRSSSETALVARFHREVEILGRLKHPGIAQIHEAGFADDGETSWFSMEYVEGVTLGKHVRQSGATREEIAALVASIADIVEHAHEKGILHRDLKPDNILVDDEGEPRVLDFGVARLTEDEGLPSLHTLTGAVIGTVAYMSPEQARGAQVDERSDVFSLGAILYELLTGRLPFETRGRSLQELVRSLAEDEPEILSSHDDTLAGDLEAIVHTAIDTIPASRYPSMGEFAADLRRWLEHRPVRARRRTMLDQVRKLVRRHRRLAVGSTVAVLILSVALVVSLYSLQKSRLAQERGDRARADVVVFSRGYSIDDLLARSEEAWPTSKEKLGDLKSLLAEAQAIADDVPEMRAYHEELRENYQRGELQDRYGDALEGRWVLREMQALIERMAALEGGLIAELQWRIAFAEEVVRSFEASQGIWKETARAVASSPAYGGLELAPQTGLVPIGNDPDSGLFEFAVILPGCTIPRRSHTTGHLVLEEDTTLVLVLLPGGSVTIGSQGEDPEAPYFDAAPLEHYWPITEHELLPFFCSKFETTQHQWGALGGDNPSYWHPGKEYDGRPFTARHPVESVTWEEAVSFLRKLGMTLPTELQFEYAARGGSTAATWWGDAEPGDPNRVNFYPRRQGTLDIYRLHAPVGTFPPNDFGLHEVMGNLAELCLDDYKVAPWTEPLNPGDGRVLAHGGGEQSVRGGNYDQSNQITLSSRHDILRWSSGRAVGFRAIRYIEGLAPPHREIGR